MRESNSAPVVRWLLVLSATLAVGAAPARTQQVSVVSLDSPAPLVTVRVMVRAGSAHDPEGLEGLAYLTARMLIEGSFGDPRAPVTKERLAEITRPWGQGAMPTVQVGKETTTFSMTVPREVLPRYVAQIFRPMFTQPLFEARELDRLRAETLTTLRSNLRLEQIELVGLVTLDNVLHAGTSYAHPVATERGAEAITREALQRFYVTYYRPEHLVLGVSTREEAVVAPLREALAGAGTSAVPPLERRPLEPPPAVQGREVVLVALPNAIATGLHAGFPLTINRRHPDYWPLYVANVWFGTHRDSFSYLYDQFRALRGYNYGDYSYIEHFENRPFALFPPTGYPRRYQYFSIWIRPVQHDYAVHLLKALTWELEHFVRTGLSEEQCALAKNKARVLYLSLAETTERLLGYRLEDAFYGLVPGYLESYLEQIDAVRCEQVNAAIRRHLQAANLKYVIVTDDEVAPKLAEAIAANQPARGKDPAEYQIEVREENGQKLYLVPEAKRALLERDAVWAHYWLDIPRDRIRIVPAERLFVTAALP
ncbi:MAG: insulinase family protein [Firmicutes bacterium]|nr:insulinase family protein [Bacillota bacterium]